MKKLVILGASGSIGQQTLEVVSLHPTDFCVVGLSVGQNISLLDRIINAFQPKYICVTNEVDYLKLKYQYQQITWYYGDQGLSCLAEISEYDVLVNALVGFVGLKPTIRAIENRKTVALANKESLVVAGNLINRLLKEKDVQLLPIDSEHSAILQCVVGYSFKEVKKVILTASGGSFRDLQRIELETVSKSDALNHPNWQMGEKITIDCATMMNKAFEIIECYHLFDLNSEQIEVVIHPQSIIHSMVEFIDGAWLAQLGDCDMKIPILFALSYPNRMSLVSEHGFKLQSMNFIELDDNRYPFVGLAYKVLAMGDAAGCVVNAANEVCVAAFLAQNITFLDIERIVFAAFELFKGYQANTYEELLDLHNLVVSKTQEFTNLCLDKV